MINALCLPNSQARCKSQNLGLSFVPICMRCDEGFKATSAVCIANRETYNSNVYKVTELIAGIGLSGNPCILTTVAQLNNLLTCLPEGYGGNQVNLHLCRLDQLFPTEIGNTNIMIILGIQGDFTNGVSGLTDLFTVSFVEEVVS